MRLLWLANLAFGTNYRWRKKSYSRSSSRKVNYPRSWNIPGTRRVIGRPKRRRGFMW